MGCVSWDVDEVSCPSKEMLFQSLAIVHAGFAAQNINGSFMGFMLMRLRPSAWGNGQDLQVDTLCTD
jgi:hypothetical protein